MKSASKKKKIRVILTAAASVTAAILIAAAAAKYGDEWTLHYSLITGMDIPNDRITVANPYGYTEEITVGEFLDRTSFAAYEKMPLFLKLGFAFGIFEKNAIFEVLSKG